MMAKKGLNLVKKGMLMTLLTWLVIGTACNDQLDNPKANPSNGKQVEVSLNIGFADEDNGISLSNSRSNNTAAGEKASTQKLAFDAQLISAVETRADEAKPDMLYNLEIRQYDASGACLNSSQSVIQNQSIGSKLTISLTQSDNCQLVIVAWGTYISNRLETGTFSDACNVMIDQSAIKELNPTNTDDMKKMPYYIYLPSVKVDASGIITSPDGTDVRLLLKRLATRVTLNWNYSYDDYKLKEVRLEAVPANYRAIPFINTKDNTYPSLLDQYTTIIVPDNITNQGTYSCWIPASLRGTSNKATSAYYRNKENAPTGSVYATFIAQHTTIAKKKLNYRLYLGSNTSDNFDLNPNTNYNYRVNFAHKGLPTNDRRVSIIDPIPASEGNDFLSPTANCFMVAPGGAFCFNPYKYYVNGIQGENSLLQDWCATYKIKSVKVLWQTKENGDLGDPTLGVVISDDDHTNIVELKNGDSFTDARIYCRVAPNTTGGSGVIAACDTNGNILWSWHVWVTNYSPSATANETILTPENKRILKLENNSTSYNPMMDRCLGAYEGYVTVPEKIVDMSRANGFHYQKGRKDPFPGSYPSEDLGTQYHFTIDGKQPPRHCLNRYKPDGINWVMPTSLNMTTLQYAYQHPESLGTGYNHEWARFYPIPDWSTNKTIHDPCPAGWRVPSESELKILVDYNQPNQNSILANYRADGGALFQYDETSNRTYMRFSGYPVSVSHIANIGYAVYLQTNGTRRIFYAQGDGGAESTNGITFVYKDNYDANNVRCIQDRSK